MQRVRCEGCLRFAVTAPWGIEFEKNIIVVVQNDFLVIVGYHDLDRALLLLRNRLRLDAGVNLALHKLLDESADLVVRDFLGLVKGEFLVLESLLDSKCGPFAIFEVEVTSVCAECLGINGGEAEDPLVLLCQWLEFNCQFSPLLWGFSEYVG